MGDLLLVLSVHMTSHALVLTIVTLHHPSTNPSLPPPSSHNLSSQCRFLHPSWYGELPRVEPSQSSPSCHAELVMLQDSWEPGSSRGVGWASHGTFPFPTKGCITHQSASEGCKPSSGQSRQGKNGLRRGLCRPHPTPTWLRCRPTWTWPPGTARACSGEWRAGRR